MKRLLLGSGGVNTPERFNAWKEEVDRFIGKHSKFLFIPYANGDYDKYVETMKTRGFDVGREIIGIHREKSAKQAVEKAEVLYVGGGNSFRLLNTLYEQDLLDVIRKRVLAGELLYIGISAGTNMACPTMKNTNDMPIVQPKSFNALNLIPFQINPHYFAGAVHYSDGKGGFQPYGGETRDDRLREFHEMNDTPILALWEGAILSVEGDTYTLKGIGGARLFLKGETPKDLPAGVISI